MKVPLLATVVFLSALAAIAWRNHRELTTLRADHDALAAKAATHGFLPDPDHPAKQLRDPKTPRPDRRAEAKRIASDFIAYAREMDPLGKSLYSADQATRLSMMEQMDEIMALNGDQLKILINEVMADGADDQLRRKLAGFLLRCLREDHPEEVLDILTSSPELQLLLGSGAAAIHRSDALRSWAMLRPDAARQWLQQHGDSVPEDTLHKWRTSLLWGAVSSDLRLALELVDEFEIDPAKVPRMMTQHRETPSQRDAALATLRNWCSTPEDPSTREDVFRDSLIKLTLGSEGGAADFQSITEWIEHADLTTQDVEFLARTNHVDLSYYINPAEAGQWIGWLGETFPPATSSQRIAQLFSNSRTHPAATRWLEDSPASPAKNAAIRSYAAWIARDKPQGAEELLREHGLSPQ